MSLIISAGTLGIGIIIGYMGQRSGFCTIGGIRNFILTKDMHLLKGAAAFVAAAFAGFLFAALIGYQQGFPAFSSAEGSGTLYNACTNPYGNTEQDEDLWRIVILTIAGGFGIGLFSVMANGCPFRQHVKASEGDTGAVAYILGFYFAAVAFGFLVKPIISGV